MKHHPFEDPDVAAIFGAYPSEMQTQLLALRQLIFETAAETAGVGEIEETLKWGQPSYLTPHTKSGTTIRIDQDKSRSGQYAIYVHCQTNLVDTFKRLYPDTFTFSGKRGLIFKVDQSLPVKEVKHCIQLALTYHRHKALKDLVYAATNSGRNL